MGAVECGKKMGQYLGKFSAPMVWKFIPKQQWDPGKVTGYLQGECCGNSREEQRSAVSWLLFMDTVHCWTAPSGGGGGNQTYRHLGLSH